MRKNKIIRNNSTTWHRIVTEWLKIINHFKIIGVMCEANTCRLYGKRANSDVVYL